MEMYRPEGLFWIDDRVVVVAGSVVQAWTPAGSWDVLVEIPQSDTCEGCGYSETAVWTGREILMWGGGFSYGARDPAAGGAAFDPRRGALRRLPRAPIEAPWWHTAIWTGDEMIVWGGACGRHECRQGAAYDPETDEWTVLAKAPMPGYAHSVVWTGSEMIVWGGSDDHEAEGSLGSPRTYLSGGAAYDPGSDTWRIVAAAPLEPRGWHSAAWTGREMIVWGGVTGPCQTAPCETLAATAAAYDPASDVWREIPAGPLSTRIEHSAVWTGKRMIVWGGGPPGGGVGYDDGAAYDPATDRWEMLPDGPLAGRHRHPAIWNGESMIVWGGQAARGGGTADGAVFSPAR